jgi:N-methylhydantoinase B
MTDRITSQLISSSLLYTSEEMGIALRNASYSPNIKERMDHSAAVFDPSGRLLAQAEHIPVHLGSLPWGLRNMVRYCIKEAMEFEQGCMIAANNPYITGTHLNDVTVIAPIHHRGELVGFAANKAHHADVGGKVPGSISMESRSVFEEGFVVDPVYLVRRGRFLPKSIELFSSRSRTPAERVGDLKAQVAANITGSRRVTELISRYGLDAFKTAADDSIRYAETVAKKRLSLLNRGIYRAVDYLEHPDGGDIRLAVTVRVSDSAVEIDYHGTASQLDIPLNAVLGVTISGAFFVFRSLVGHDLPANEGAFSPVVVRAPSGTLVNPTFPHPVGGGNVETSQRNADLLFKALYRAAPKLVPAACGGSMNNVMMGGRYRGRGWAFYETIGVGLGGKEGMDGLDGIQANMTNTMNTPVEELERSFPVMLTRYEFREDSPGPGRYRGGAGIVRGYRMLGRRTVFTVISERERHRPWGLAGGGHGAATRVFLIRNGRMKRIGSKRTVVLGMGDEVVILTAGGGGYGEPHLRDSEAIWRDMSNGIITPAYARRHYEIRVVSRSPRRRPVPS